MEQSSPAISQRVAPEPVATVAVPFVHVQVLALFLTLSAPSDVLETQVCDPAAAAVSEMT